MPMSDDIPIFIVRSALNHVWRSCAGKAPPGEWVRARIGFYLRYTVPSLLRQTDHDLMIRAIAPYRNLRY